MFPSYLPVFYLKICSKKDVNFRISDFHALLWLQAIWFSPAGLYESLSVEVIPISCRSGELSWFV
ncbi:MAG: hypothetical protein CSA32_02925 [Desulfobulbus propionicus]|nr:MAG: hypothetical protein CSA32_02925 [Desulfobulbus propionicus]